VFAQEQSEFQINKEFVSWYAKESRKAFIASNQKIINGKLLEILNA